MARLPKGWSRMLCALIQFGSLVSAVNRPSPPTARTRRSAPRTVLSKRFSSESSSTRSWPETTTIGEPIMSSQKIGPSSLASRVRCCTGAAESSDSMLPTTGLVGGCGIGSSRFLDDIDVRIPLVVIPGRCAAWNPESRGCGFGPADHPGTTLQLTPTTASSPKPPSTPFDQLGADLLRLLLLRPMAAVLHQVLLQIGNELLHAIGGRRRQHRVVLGHDHQRRHAHRVIEPLGAYPVARHVAVPIDAAGKAGPGEIVDEHLLLFRRQDRRAGIVLRIVARDHLRKCQVQSRRGTDTCDDFLRRSIL